FHPKILVGGKSFLECGEVSHPLCGYLGSANFTSQGMGRNLEVMFLTSAYREANDVAAVFRNIWINASEASEEAVSIYECEFERAQRRRSPYDLSLLEVREDAEPGEPTPAPLIRPKAGTAVWVGL